MALSLAGFKARIDNSLKLLGKQSDTVQEQNISDAVSKFISKMDHPIHGATFDTESGTATYSVPATIRKIQDIRDSDGDSVNFTLDSTTNEFVLQSTPDSVETFTVYGTWNSVRTNLSAIIADTDESLEHVLWAYVNAYCYEWANEDTAANKLQKADFLANEERRSNNVILSMDFVTMQNYDTKGKRIADAANAEGFNVQVNGLYQSDL